MINFIEIVHPAARICVLASEQQQTEVEFFSLMLLCEVVASFI
jgi:hypothetical protein